MCNNESPAAFGEFCAQCTTVWPSSLQLHGDCERPVWVTLLGHGDVYALCLSDYVRRQLPVGSAGSGRETAHSVCPHWPCSKIGRSYSRDAPALSSTSCVVVV